MVDVTDVVNEALDLALHAPVLELHLAQLVRAHDRLAAAVRRAALLGCKHVGYLHLLYSVHTQLQLV